MMTLQCLGRGAEKIAGTTKKGVFLKPFLERREEILVTGSRWNYQMLIAR